MWVVGVMFLMEEFGCHNERIFAATLIDLLLAGLVAGFLGSQRQFLPIAVIATQVMMLLGPTQNAQFQFFFRADFVGRLVEWTGTVIVLFDDLDVLMDYVIVAG